MKKRDMEIRKPILLNKIIDKLYYSDLQGVFKNENKIIAGYEAVDLEDSEMDELGEILTENELYVKCCFCDQLNADFFLLIHKIIEEQNVIYVKKYKANYKSSTPELISETIYNETDFINQWWTSMAGTYRQTKETKSQFKEEVAKSYFDNLLEKHSRSWTFNIDGFIYNPKEKKRVVAIIENRISNKKSYDIYNYEPADYYNEDSRIWTALKQIAQRLNVPLVLCTYSRRENRDNVLGAAVIKDVENYISYDRNISPRKNLLYGVTNFIKWLKSKNVEIYEKRDL